MDLKPGDVLNIDGIDCVLDQYSIDAIEVWKKVFETGDRDEKEVLIGFYTVKGEAKSFSPSKILEALKKAETIDWNRSPQGL